SKHRLLGMLNLSPGSIITDDRHNRQILANHALKFHAIEAKGPITMQNQYFLPWPGNLCCHRETSPCTKTTHRTGIEPVARLIDVDYTSTIAHNVATIAHNRRILVNKVAYLAAETHRVNRHR